MKARSMPNELRHKIMQKGARGGKLVVAFDKQGRPKPNVYRLDQYLKKLEGLQKSQPWAKRKKQATTAPLLPTVDGDVLGPLTRERMYEE